MDITEKRFFDKLIEEYTEQTGQDISAEGLGYYLEYFLDNYPPEKLELKLSRKIAARIAHEFMLNVLKIPDQDWGEASKLKDIYDCRVCSNAIAQVYTRGVVEAAEVGRFGLNDIVSESQAERIISKLIGLKEK